MESTLLCPQCLSVLNVDDSGSASCSVHGSFDILFSREAEKDAASEAVSAPAPGVPDPAEVARQNESLRALAALGLAEKVKPEESTGGGPVPEGKCAKHHKMDAVQVCTQCKAPMCRMCTYRAPYGKKICPKCTSDGPSAVPVGQSGGELALAPSAQTGVGAAAAVEVQPAKKVNPAMAGVMCSTHPDVQAINKCRVCSAGVCETCDFKVGGSVHACPVCIMKPGEGLSSKRLKYVVGGFLCAGATIFFYVMGEMQSSSAFMIFSLISSMIGVAVGFAPMEKRLSNSIPLWMGAILNLLLFGLRLVIVLLVTFRRL